MAPGTVADRCRRRAAGLGAAAVAALAVAGCGNSGATTNPDVVRGGTLTIYSSGPLTGRQRERAADAVRGERLALREAGGRVGRFRIRLVALDDASPTTGLWDPDRVSANARRAAEDPTTIAYLGEFAAGASAIAIPILNERQILTVTPGDTVAGLTTTAGAASGEPDKYYPTETRTFGRILPADDRQAAALTKAMRADGARRLVVIDDDTLYGRTLGLRVLRTARRVGITPVQGITVDAKRTPLSLDDQTALARDVAAARPDAVLLAGAAWAGGSALFDSVAEAVPGARLYGPGALAADSAFVRGLGPAARVTTLTDPQLPAASLPGGRAFARRFERAFARAPGPAAAYGHEAMAATLAAIRAAAPRSNDRPAVVAAFFALRDRRSALGRYSITGDGDTTVGAYALVRPAGGGLALQRTVTVPPD